jgi:hypothetical protein
VIYQVGFSTIGRAIGEIRPLLAERGFAVPQRPGLRLRTLADVFAYAELPTNPSPSGRLAHARFPRHGASF